MNGNADHAEEDQNGLPPLSAERAGEALNEDVHALREEVERLRKRVEDDDTVAIVRKIFALEEPAQAEKDEEVAKKGFGEKIAGACDSLWGGAGRASRERHNPLMVRELLWRSHNRPRHQPGLR